MNRFDAHLQSVEPGVRDLIGGMPLLSNSPLPPDWARCEMLERFDVLRRAGIEAGDTILEVGSGAHALATVPLAFLAGPSGRVVAAERSRWAPFRTLVGQSGIGDRIGPIGCDARRMPLRDDCVDLAVCIHGVRSLRGEENIVRTFREMLRVSSRLFVAESLPIARTNAQRAHLAMYNLRHEVFFAISGTPDDLPYDPLERLAAFAIRAGGNVETTWTLEVDLPHSLAYFPRSLVETIPAEDVRQELLHRWDEAAESLRRFGEDHPPVGVVVARRV